MFCKEKAADLLLPKYSVLEEMDIEEDDYDYSLWCDFMKKFQSGEDIEDDSDDDSTWSISDICEEEIKKDEYDYSSDASNSSYDEEEGTTATSSVSGVSEDISVLSENLKNLYLKKSCADITIKVKTQEFLAHKAILVARSEVFAFMFQHDSLEKASGIIEITDCDPESFEDFLLYLYTANLEIVTSKNVVGLYKTSDKYGCKELLKRCVQCMVQELTVDTFCDYFELESLHSEPDLLMAAINFFSKNANAIFRTTKWLTLLKKHPSLCNELLIKFTDTE